MPMYFFETDDGLNLNKLPKKGQIETLSVVFIFDKAKILFGNRYIGWKEISFSNPPEGKWKVTNLYVDPQTGKFLADYDDGS